MVLEYIFDVFDFDGRNIHFNIRIFFFSCYLENKQLDRREYNLWTVRTTGEDITDNDWESIRSKIFPDLKKCHN